MFFRILRNSPSSEVRVMAGLAGRNLGTTTGRNLRLVSELSGLDPWIASSEKIKEQLLIQDKADIPLTDQWRVPYLSSLLEKRQSLHYQGEEEGAQEVTKLIDSLCIN